MDKIHRTWIIAEGSMEGTILGPIIRVLEMGKQARDAGSHVTVLLDKQINQCTWGTIQIRPLTQQCLLEITPGDAVIISAQMHPKFFLELIRRKIPFDIDLYNVAPFEHIEVEHGGIAPFRIFQSRRRVARRYRILLERAERFYLSNPQQLTFLGGLLFSRADARSSKMVSRLPEHCMFLPMGCNPRPKNSHPNPYPSSLQNRPIFLWGGGIWKWFDTSTLIEAFKILSERNSSAALFFLAATNPTSNTDHDEPVKRTIESAKKLGLLDKNVFFSSKKVGPENLPEYLSHCYAGIMTNPVRMESFGSWRTRLLDLIPYGKPIVTSGFDPLSQQLNLTGASKMVPASDPFALADAIEDLIDSQVYSQASAKMLEIQPNYDWTNRFKIWRDRITDSNSFKSTPAKIAWYDKLLFVIGL